MASPWECYLSLTARRAHDRRDSHKHLTAALNRVCEMTALGVGAGSSAEASSELPIGSQLPLGTQTAVPGGVEQGPEDLYGKALA